MIELVGLSTRVVDWHAYRCDQCNTIIHSPYAAEHVVCDCRTREPLSLYGPGTELKKILDFLGAKRTSGCGCLAMIVKMNAWGIEGTIAHRAEIVAHLQAAYEQLDWNEAASAILAGVLMAWSMRLNPLDKEGSLVDAAIRRAEQNTATTPTAQQVQAVLDGGILSASQIREALKIDVPEEICIPWLDGLAQQGLLASIVLAGQKHYGLPADHDTMS